MIGYAAAALCRVSLSSRAVQGPSRSQSWMGCCGARFRLPWGSQGGRGGARNGAKDTGFGCMDGLEVVALLPADCAFPGLLPLAWLRLHSINQRQQMPTSSGETGKLYMGSVVRGVLSAHF